MEGRRASIDVHAVNAQMVGLSELSSGSYPKVLVVPGGGRVLVASKDTLALMAELLGPSARATNPYEQRRRKEFLRRAQRCIEQYVEATTPSA